MTAPRIIIQRVRCSWTKASRGGDAARRRNSLPRQLTLPLEAFAAPVTLHRVDFDEANGFERREAVERFRFLSELALIALAIRWIDDRLEAKHLRSSENVANLYRPNAFIGGVEIANGQWGELRENGRYVDYDTGNWSYDATTYNVGLFSEVEIDRYVATTPAKRYADLARL